MPPETQIVRKTPAAAILIAWLVVSLPAAWGVYNTVLNAKKIFTSTPVRSPQ